MLRGQLVTTSREVKNIQGSVTLGIDHGDFNIAAQLGQRRADIVKQSRRSEEHTSELQSPYDLVCRLLLEKKKKKKKTKLPTNKHTYTDANPKFRTTQLVRMRHHP